MLPPTFHFDGDPEPHLDLELDPTHRSDANLWPQAYRAYMAPFSNLYSSWILILIRIRNRLFTLRRIRIRLKNDADSCRSGFAKLFITRTCFNTVPGNKIVIENTIHSHHLVTLLWASLWINYSMTMHIPCPGWALALHTASSCRLLYKLWSTTHTSS